MKQVFSFLIAHWQLSLLFIGSFFWIIVLEAQSKLAKSVSVSTSKATELVNHEDAAIVDIRDNNAFADGHIVGAKHILADNIQKDAKSALKSLKNKPCILVCGQGQQSLKLVNKLRSEGFDQLFALMGGMEAWKKDTLPVVK